MEFPLWTQFTVEPWADAVIDARGFEPTAPYVELCWLPVIGPSATWMIRRLACGLKVHPEGYPVVVDELASNLGLGKGRSRNAPVMRTLQRLTGFGLIQPRQPATVAVRRRIPPLTLAQVRRLSPALQRVHHQLVSVLPAEERLGA